MPLDLIEAPASAAPLGSAPLPKDTKEAANFLGVSASWLNNARIAGNGPPFYRVGRAVRYMTEDLAAWRQAQRRTSTSQA